MRLRKNHLDLKDQRNSNPSAFNQQLAISRACYMVESLESRLLLSAVSSGQEISANISASAQQDQYTFSATAGGTIEASVGDPGQIMELGLDLLSPTGTLIKSVAATSNEQTITFTQTASTSGTYVIVVKSVNGGVGDYQFSFTASAAPTTTTVTVDGNEGPWLYINGGLNTAFQYGLDDQAGPTVINASDGLNFTAGNIINVKYFSGLVSAGIISGGGTFPDTDANGDTASVINNALDRGLKYPSYYFNPATYPAYLAELVGTFANSSGAIVGTPFVIGDSASLTIPTGATQLQLGVNDDIFSDNTGSWQIQVTEQAASPAPTITSVTTEPTSLGNGSYNWAFAITGTNLGSLTPYTKQDSAYINLVDSTRGFSVGYTGDPITATVTSWTGTSIDISGLAGAYGTSDNFIQPGDDLTLVVENPQTNQASRVFDFTAAVPVQTSGSPSISSIKFQPIAANPGNYTITIMGSNLGTQNSFNGDSADLLILDVTKNIPAGENGDVITMDVTQWSNSQIVVQELGGKYGQTGLTFGSGDQISITLTNPQTTLSTTGFATVPPSVTPSVTGVSFAPLAGDNWMVTINGTGFGTESAFDSPTPFLDIDDTTNSLSAAGEGDAVVANITSWQNSQIVISGFKGAYGASLIQVFNPGDSLSFLVTNPQSGAAMPSPFVASIPISTQPPTITSATITSAAATDEFNVTVVGSGLGSTQPFIAGFSAYITLTDTVTGAIAGPSGSSPVSVSLWSNTEISLSFSEPSSGAQFGFGDSVKITIYNPQQPSLPSASTDALMPAVPQSTVDIPETLSLVNQSLWGSTSAGDSFDYFLGSQWQSNSYSLPLGVASLNAGYGAGQIGLDFSGSATVGGANASYPVDVQLTGPDAAISGGSVTVQTGFGNQGGQASIQTTAPALGLQLALEALVSANASISIPGPFGSKINLVSVNPSVDWSYPLLGAGISGIQGSISLPAGFSINYDLTSDALPTAQAKANVSGGLSTISATGQGSDFLSLSDDLVALAAALAGGDVTPVGAALSVIDGATAQVPDWVPLLGGEDLDYHILQATLAGGLHLTEAVNLIPKVSITLTSNDGQTQSGYLGQAFSFTMPKSGSLQLSATLNLAGSELATTWGLGTDLTGSVDLLEGDILGVQFGPLFNASETLFDSGTLANVISTGDFPISTSTSVVPTKFISNALNINVLSSKGLTPNGTTVGGALSQGISPQAAPIFSLTNATQNSFTDTQPSSFSILQDSASNSDVTSPTELMPSTSINPVLQ